MQLECWYNQLYVRHPGAGVDKYQPETQCVSNPVIRQEEPLVDTFDGLSFFGLLFGLILVLIFGSIGDDDE